MRLSILFACVPARFDTAAVIVLSTHARLKEIVSTAKQKTKKQKTSPIRLMANAHSNLGGKNMKKYDDQYYLIEKKYGEHFPSLVADENTEDRAYTYERQLVGTPPLVFFNGWKEENLARHIKATVPDILFNGSNLVVRSDIREKLLNYDIPNLHMHPTVYIHDDGKWYEDYWYMTFTERFDCWDRNDSDYEQDDPPIRLGGFELYQVYSYSLNEELLDKIPLEQRLLFQMGGTLDPYFICHQKLLGLFRGDGKSGAKLTPIHEY